MTADPIITGIMDTIRDTVAALPTKEARRELHAELGRHHLTIAHDLGKEIAAERARIADAHVAIADRRRTERGIA